MALLSDDAPVRMETLEDGAIWRVVIGGSKGNVLDAAVLRGLESVFEAAGREAALRAVVLEGEGRHFSFGASVQEHLPDQVEAMLGQLRRTLLALFDSRVVHVAAVRGLCLGGALELACCCHRIVAAPDARLGQPEIALGVFAPVASVLLRERVGRGAAEDLCLTGRSVESDEALRWGLVDAVSDDPGAAALAWVREHLLPRSASSLRLAVRAARLDLRRRFAAELEELERLYLEELMATADAKEGLTAFLEKRPPVWRHA